MLLQNQSFLQASFLTCHIKKTMRKLRVTVLQCLVITMTRHACLGLTVVLLFFDVDAIAQDKSGASLMAILMKTDLTKHSWSCQK